MTGNIDVTDHRPFIFFKLAGAAATSRQRNKNDLLPANPNLGLKENIRLLLLDRNSNSRFFLLKS